MKLNVEYFTPHSPGWSNESFGYIYDSITKSLKNKLPEIDEVTVIPITAEGHPPAGEDRGVSSMKFINPNNGKTTVLTFWDRGLDILAYGNTWEKYNIVQLIGGLGVRLDEVKRIQTYRNVKYSPFPYPIPFPRCYEMIDRLRTKYNYKMKVKKACFIGSLYHGRTDFVKYIEKHPMFQIHDSNQGFHFEAYYNEMRKYAMVLSLNGGGEYCIRDFEAMGMGIPLFRPQLSCTTYEELVPNKNYIVAAKPVWEYSSLKDQADEFIANVEKFMPQEELLNSISQNNLEYYEKYVRLDRMVELFFEVFDLNLLK